LYIPVRAVEGTTLTTGYAVVMACDGNSIDGISVLLADSDDAAGLPGFCGVAASDIADAGYGLVQCFGFANSVRFSDTGTSVTITLGDACVPGKGAGGLTSGVAPSYADSGFKFVIPSNLPATLSAAGWMSGVLKCL